MLAAARADAERMVSADGVRRAAEAEARGVLEAARERADRLRADADAYADERLAALEDTLSRLLGTVERGRDLLRRPPDGAADTDWPGLAPPDGPAGRGSPADAAAGRLRLAATGLPPRQGAPADGGDRAGAAGPGGGPLGARGPAAGRASTAPGSLR